MMYYGTQLDSYLSSKAAFDANFNQIFLFFLSYIFAFTCQDVAVDGLAISVMDDKNKIWASLTQSIGQIAGVFAGSTLFVWLNNVEFLNQYV